jgi:hypothetical protein
MHKKVYMQPMRLLFVLLEKSGRTLFRVGTTTSIEGNESVKQMGLTYMKRQNHHYLSLNLWEN